MSYRSVAPLKAQVYRVLAIVALPLACAVGVDPDAAPSDDIGTDGGSGGSSSAGSPSTSGTTGVVPKAGNSSTGGSGAFGGSASTGGAATAGAAGTTSTAGKASGGASGSGGAGGSGGSSAGAGGSAAGAAGTAGTAAGGTANPPSCDCKQKTLEWKDMTNMSFVTGDCLTADGKTFLYTGAMAQTWAHPDCHPGKQMAWCPGSGYVFMACD